VSLLTYFINNNDDDKERVLEPRG